MDMREFYVSITPNEVLKVINQSIVAGSFSGTLIDEYQREMGTQQLVVCIVEKYFMRSSNRATLTVTIDNMDGATKVHAVASGGGEGAFFRFDWGAGNSFVQSLENALQQYKVERT